MIYHPLLWGFIICSRNQGEFADTMEKHVKRYLYLIILGCFIIAISGCGGTHHAKSRYKLHHDPQGDSRAEQGFQRQVPPPPVDIMITIKGWKIVQHRIMGNTGRLGDIRFAGRFLFLDDLVFKLKAEKAPDWYWLVKIPLVEEGMYEIRARTYREYSQDLSPIEAPEQFKVSMRIEDKIISGHYIVDPEPRWGYFQVSGYRSPILYLKNQQYPGRVWATKLPREDGTWTIYITLIR